MAPGTHLQMNTAVQSRHEPAQGSAGALHHRLEIEPAGGHRATHAHRVEQRRAIDIVGPQPRFDRGGGGGAVHIGRDAERAGHRGRPSAW